MRLFGRKWGNALCDASIAFELHLATSEDEGRVLLWGAQGVFRLLHQLADPATRGVSALTFWKRPHRLTWAGESLVENLEKSRVGIGAAPARFQPSLPLVGKGTAHHGKAVM